jgi:hypothetical protein
VQFFYGQVTAQIYQDLDSMVFEIIVSAVEQASVQDNCIGQFGSALIPLDVEMSAFWSFCAGISCLSVSFVLNKRKARVPRLVAAYAHTSFIKVHR